jgi:hypothetical protein
LFRTIVRTFIALCLIPVWVPLLLLIIAWIAAVMISCSVALFIYIRWQAWQSGNWRYVVVSPRRGWNEFAANNLQAALPAGVGMIWRARKRAANQRYRDYCSQWLASHGRSLSKPCLVEIGLLRIRARSLHQQFMPMKSMAHKDRAAQQRLRELLNTVLRPHRH